MTTKIDTGGHAFPTPEDAWDGMTLRDWFAGQALGPLVAQNGETHTDRAIAGFAYAYADVMLAARRDE